MSAPGSPAEAYILALSDALWAWADATAPAETRYRDLDLRRAIVCKEFFRLRDDADLQSAFACGGPAPQLAHPTAQTVANRLLGAGPSPRRRRRPSREHLVHLLRRLGPPPRRRREGALDLLVLAFHPKFLRYLDPILEQLPLRFALGVTRAPELRRAPCAARWAQVRADLGPRRLPGRRSRLLRGYPDLTFDADALSAELRQSRPRGVLLVEGNLPRSAVAREVARAHGVPAFCVQQGWAPWVHAGFRRLDYDAFLTWGPGFAELLAPHSPGLTTRAIGQPHLRPADPAGRRVACFLQGALHGIRPTDLRSFLSLIERAARAHPETAFDVREHPQYGLTPGPRARLDALPNVHWRNAPLPLAEVLASARLCLSIHSSTLYEAAAVGVTPLRFNPEGRLPPLAPDVIADGAGVEAHTVEAGLAHVAEAIRDPSWSARFQAAQAALRARCFPYLGDASARRAAETLVELLG